RIRGHLDGQVRQNLADRERLLAKPYRLLVFLGEDTLNHHVDRHPGEPPPVPQPRGEHLGAAQVLLHPLPVRERNQRGPEIEPEVDGELGDVALLRDMAERLERLLEVGDRLTVRGAAHRPESRLAEIADCLLPHLAVQGMWASRSTCSASRSVWRRSKVSTIRACRARRRSCSSELYAT